MYKYPSYVALNDSLNGIKWAHFINLFYIIYITLYSIPITEFFDFNSLTTKSIVIVCQGCSGVLIIWDCSYFIYMVYLFI